MKKILAAWSLKVLQEYINIHTQLERHGKTIEDVKQYLSDIKKANIKRQELLYTAHQCPNCKKDMVLEPINQDPKGRDKYGSPNYKSWWRCPECQTTILNEKTVLEEINSTMPISNIKKTKRK